MKVLQYFHLTVAPLLGGSTPTPEPAGTWRSRAKSLQSLLLLRALRPGAAHPGVGFGIPGSVQLVLYITHFFSLGGMTRRQSYSSSLHSPETLTATLLLSNQSPPTTLYLTHTTGTHTHSYHGETKLHLQPDP